MSMIDFHSHILPRIDDGSRSVEQSLEMLRLEAAQGVSRVVLTPHFYPRSNTPERFLENRSHAMALLQEQLAPYSGLPELKLGAEVHYYPHMSSSEALRELAIEGTTCVMIEMPSAPWTEQMYRELELIHENLGLTPIIAHVDRYLGRFRDHGIPKRLAQLPVYVQANAEFLLNSGSRAMKLLHHKQIHVLGSDCHNLTDRAPNLGTAMERIRTRMGQQTLDWIESCGTEIFSAMEDDAL